jgi:hypothetical protein
MSTSRTPGSAVTSVTGWIFREGWSRVRGSRQGLGDDGRRHGQMVRAARGNRAAVFKAIRSGGCSDRAALVRQLEYLTTKSSHIVDSRGVLDGRQVLTTDEIGTVADRYVRRWSDGLHPKLGHTTHMLMSFPIGTRGADVRDIASDVCSRFFSNDEGHFDYLIAVHEDRAHPHAHVVLNRRSQEGELFWLGKDHRFNYDDLRMAMVETAETYGVRLEATRRLDRGLVHYAARTQEVYAAHEEGRAPVERERTGRDLRAAEAEVRRVAKEYRRLGRVEEHEETQEALQAASRLLAKGERLAPHEEVYVTALRALDMPEIAEKEPGSTYDIHFDEDAVAERIEALRDGLREAGLGEPQIAGHDEDIEEAAWAGIEREQRDWLARHGSRTFAVDAVCHVDEDGMASLADLGLGAEVERQVGRMVEYARGQGAAVETPDEVAGAVAMALRQMYRGLEDEEPIPDHLARGLGRTYELTCRLMELERTLVREAKEAEYRELLHVSWHRMKAPDVSDEACLEIAQVVWDGRDSLRGALPRGQRDPARVAAFRQELEDAIGPERLDALRRGDADALDGLLADRMDRLRAAHAYLRTDPDHEVAHGAAMRGVVEEIAERDIASERLVHGHNLEHGITH